MIHQASVLMIQDTWPSDADLPFMSVINENLINLSDIEDDIASGDESHSGVGAEFGIVHLGLKVVALTLVLLLKALLLAAIRLRRFIWLMKVHSVMPLINIWKSGGASAGVI